MRETWIAILDLAGYAVQGAATAEAAISAIDRRSFHVALVDMMLAGPDDKTNRDGAKVLDYLRAVGDPTRSLVLSAQDDDVTLARDMIKDYGAHDYLKKRDVEEKGNKFLLETIKDAMPTVRPPTWEQLTKIVLSDLSEQQFVSECLYHLKFGGGFENLSRSLIAACQNLFPLVGEAGASRGLTRTKVPEVFSGTFWSRGQGTAIELLVYGRNALSETVESAWSLSRTKLLFSRSKSDLSIVVVPCSNLARGQFEFSHR
jgi:ActR/RegA family two-component response regulator